MAENALAPCGESCACNAPADQSPRCACGLYRLGEACPYCGIAVRQLKPESDTRDALQEEAGRRMDAARDAARDSTRAEIEVSRAESLRRQPPVKAKRSRRTQKEMAALRAQRYARTDATPDDELAPALLDDPLPLLGYELDDMQKDIQGALK